MTEKNYYVQVTESIGAVYELSARIDERVKNVMIKQNQLEEKIDNQLSEYSKLRERIAIVEESESCATNLDFDNLKDELHEIEIRLHEVELKANNSANKWGSVFEFFKSLFWIVAAAYVLTKLGLQSPNIP